MTEWKLVDWTKHASGCLEVSSCGRVRRPAFAVPVARTRNGRTHAYEHNLQAKELSPCKTHKGYLEIAVKVDGVRKKFLVHRLVARAFCPGYEPHLTVNHINGIKTDNRAANLEWVTLARNTELQWQTGLVNLRGERQPGAKLTAGKVLIIRDLLRMGATANSLAVLLGVSSSLIDLIRDGKRWHEVVAADDAIAHGGRGTSLKAKAR